MKMGTIIIQKQKQKQKQLQVTVEAKEEKSQGTTLYLCSLDIDSSCRPLHLSFLSTLLIDLRKTSNTCCWRNKTKRTISTAHFKADRACW